MKQNLPDKNNKPKFLLGAMIIVAVVFTYVAVVFIQKVFDGTYQLPSF